MAKRPRRPFPKRVRGRIMPAHVHPRGGGVAGDRDLETALDSATDLEDRLFLAMLQLARNGAGPEFDLVAVCRDLGIEAGPQELIAFTSDNDGLRGSRHLTMSSIRFTMSAEGRRHARELEERFRPRTLRDRIGSVPRSDWIAIGALVVSLIALLK